MYDNINTPPPHQPNHQQLEDGLPHDEFAVGCPAADGRVYVFIGSFVQAPPPLTIRPPDIVPFPCGHNSGESSNKQHTAVIPVTNSPQKEFTTDNKPTVRVYCRSLLKYSLTVRDGKVTLAPTITSDPHQRWIKEDKFGKNVKDEKGLSSFALVNKATGQAIKDSIGEKYPVQLIKYDPDKLDESVLWTRGHTPVCGYSSLRAVYNIYLNLDAYDSTKDLEKTEIIQDAWNGSNNQLWNLAFFCK